MSEPARSVEDVQTRKAGEAERAMALRHFAVIALRQHAGEMAEVAKVALAERHQLREALGLRQR